MKFLLLATTFMMGCYSVTPCLEEWNNQCKTNSDCCTNYCENPNGWEFGVCKTSETTAACQEDGSNQCKVNSDCCSEICNRPADWEFGICSKKSESTAACQADGSNQCKVNSDCCSEICENPNGWEFGICKESESASTCQEEWSNKCKTNSDCCTNYCENPNGWEFGVCKKGETECLKSMEAGCDKSNCCSGLQCFNGTDGTWTRGVCIDDKLMETLLGFSYNGEGQDDTYGDDYLQFVKNYLLGQNGITSENTRVKCKEIDPTGSFFYRYDEEYSFRICDACKELPIRKLNAIKIDEEPINILDSTTFDQCFGECIDNKMCVACSYDKYQRQCHLFDTIEDNFEETEDWQTLIIPQPVDVLRDYVFSRNTVLKCLENTTEVHPANSMLECFSLCEKNDCSLAEYSEGECVTVQDYQDCYTTFYKYGHTSLFYKDYFSDDISWRFNKSGQELFGYEEDLDSTDDTNTQVAEATRTGSVSSEKQLRELKFKQDIQYFTECQDKCLNLTTCVGIDIKIQEQDYECTMIDVRNIESMTTNSVSNSTRVQLIHPRRDSILYGFATQLIARFSAINYATTSKQKNIVDCIGVCKNQDKCKDVLYNYADQTCLTNDDIIGTNRRNVVNNDKWIMLSKNRPRYDQPEFKFTLLGRNKRLANEHDQFITLTQTFPKTDEDGLNKCLSLCLEKDNKSDTCNLVQVERSSTSIKCKLYNIGIFNQTVNSEDILFSNLYLITLNKNFNQDDLDQMPLMSEEDAINCEIDKESVLLDLIYLNANNQTSNVPHRSKRGFWSSVGNFFKGVGKAIKDTVVNTVETVKGGVKAIGKLVKGDTKGALKEVKKTPLYKEGEKLVKNVKQVGEGIVKGDIKKIGEGLLGVATNDLLAFIPGQKAISTGAKAIKGGIKNTIEKTTKKDATKKPPKDNIVDKSFKDKKSEEKAKEDKRQRECEKKKTRRRRDVTGKDDDRDFYSYCREEDKNKDKDKDLKCDIPQIAAKMGNKVIKPTLEDCKNFRVGEECNYLCYAGYKEKPENLACIKKGNDAVWNKKALCEPQECIDAGQYTYIFVESSTIKSVLDLKNPDPKKKDFKNDKPNSDVLLYLVKFNDAKKLPIYSVTYYKWILTFGKLVERKAPFRLHPCKRLARKQATNNDYPHVTAKNPRNNPHGFEKGHLTPADLFRWNTKTQTSSSLLINIAPQAKEWNGGGGWGRLEANVQCASQNTEPLPKFDDGGERIPPTGAKHERTKINSIVATGIILADKPKYKIGANIEVPKYFWKMVCYREVDVSEKKNQNIDTKTTHVVLFVAKNEPVDMSDQDKEFLFTPRSQRELNTFDSNILTEHNPWDGVTMMRDRNMTFNLINRYPTPDECKKAMDLDAVQEKKWRKQMGSEKSRRKRATDDVGDVEAFCNQKDVGDILGTILAAREGEAQEESEDAENEDDLTIEDKFDGNVNVPSSSCGKKIVGYYPSWTKKKLSASLLSKFTHIIFAFLEMRADGTVGIGNPDHSSAQTSTDAEVEDLARSNLKALMENKAKVPGLKVTFAVGGWENSQYFSSMAANPTIKQNFIASVLRAIDEYDFDGVDIDWEYPVTGGAKEGIPQDKQNYVSLLKDLRGVLEAKSPKTYLITFASAAGEDALKNGYDLPGLLKYADWVNIMSYDFFGPWESKWGAYTGPPAPLFHNVPKGYAGKFNVNWAIKQYVCDLQSPKQVVMGVPLYGRYWNNVPDKQGEHAMYRLATRENGKFIGGFVSWSDIKKSWLTDPNFQSHFDDKVKCPYAYNQNGTYLGYESPESVKFKIEFAIKSNLGGLMVWAIDQDDDDQSMITQLSQANLCTNDDSIKFKCIPIKEKRWWTLVDGENMGGLCGKSAPLYHGYYPVCDPDDLGYSCCGEKGYCGSGDEYCNCPTCINYADDPNKMLAEPTKPKTNKITWHFSNAPEGQRGRCGRDVPKVNGEFATCNPDDQNAYCCSNGGYCGSGDSYCKCDGCINFKDNPSYQYPPKTWWSYSDGANKSGKCGPKAPKLPNGGEPGCDPDSPNHCCSNHGYCVKDNVCQCSGCKDYKR